MNGMNQQAGSAKTRRARVIRVAPITRAVRLALAASATVLALSASGAALAGTCTFAGDSSVHCNGAFSGTVYYVDTDLTLILGDSAPTTVTPPPYYDGVVGYGYNTATVISDADINVNGAPGLEAFSSTATTVINTGNIQAYSSGIRAGAFRPDSTTSVDNSGNVDVTADGDAFGIYATSGGTTTVSNSGDISATSYSGLADGIFARGTSVSVANSGSIDATSDYGLADGIFASGVNVAVANSGTISATGYSWAAGIEAQGSDLTTVDNSGSIDATSTGGYSHAYGIYATGDGGISIGNSGTITSTGSYATGIEARSGGSGAAITIDNSGDIIVGDAYASYYANGIHASSNFENSDITVVNSGSITANSIYGSTGIAIVATGTGSNASVDNSGDISVSTTGPYNATGIVASGDDNATVVNSGSITVGYGGQSYGAMALAFNGTATVSNSGDITVETADFAGNGYGIVAFSQNGVANADNTGTINVATAGYGGYYGFGILASGTAGASATNAGSITAQGIYAYGIETRAGHGDASISNAVDGEVTAISFVSFAAGAVSVSTVGNASVDNAGSINAISVYDSIGVLSRARHGDAGVDNAGDVLAYSVYGNATGVLTRANFGQATANNSGSIAAYSLYGNATGVYGNGRDGASVGITNSGDITAIGGASMQGGNGYGIVASSQNGAVQVDNYGTIQAAGYDVAMGILAQFEYAAAISNGGTISVLGQHAYGIYAASDNGGLVISNQAAGTIEANSDTGNATGIAGALASGGVTIDNAGTIVAQAGENAFGVVARVDDGDITVDNSGSISAHAQTQVAFGISAAAGGAVSVSNTGSVLADGGTYAFGIYTAPPGNSGVDASVVNSGSVSAYATDNAFGIAAFSGVAPGGYLGDTSVNNSGHIYASGASASGIRVDGLHLEVANTGTVMADASIGANGTAVGISADSSSSGVVRNGDDGVIEATGFYRAIGVSMFGAYGNATITNAGDIHASSLAAGGNATGVMVGGFTGGHLDNSGSIRAQAAHDSVVVGAQVFGIVGATVVNTGLISASATSGTSVTGLKVSSGAGQEIPGGILIDNAGLITASNDTVAYGVVMSIFGNAGGTSTLNNSGTIRTYAATEGQIAVLGLYGAQSIQNSGQLFGAVVTGGGDDVLDNHSGGVWHVGNHATNFGAGDDTIHNAAGGTIVLDNAAIALGSSTSVGNAFLNDGVIAVRGDSLIDMGSGVAADTLVPSLNPLPFTNNGVIDFVDGAPDDILTIQGDLAGHGAVNLDVNPLTHASDLLRVDGSIASGTAQTVNVAFNGKLSTALATPVPFAYVTGNSSAGAFVGGGIVGYNTPGDFLDLKVNVTSQIDASNATPDVFSVGVEALGLNDNGVLAASIASGAQSLVNTQIGTWRQRMGVMPPAGQIGVSPWVRVFGDNGDVSPDHVARNFGQGGNFDYRQSNSGTEVGLDTRPAEHLDVGLLLSKSDGRQRLNAPGSGNDDLSARTFGLFGTWMGDNGFYVDASYRWTAFDARLRSQGITRKASGQIGSFNVEAGFNAWTLPGNVTLQPQAQYTRSEVTDVHPVQGQLADFQTHGAVSSRGRLGVAFTKVIDRSGLVWTPYGSINAVREFDGDYNFAINNDFSGATSTKGTSALVELGLGMRKDHFSLTGGVNWADGGALQSVVGGQLVARYSW